MAVAVVRAAGAAGIALSCAGRVSSCQCRSPVRDAPPACHRRRAAASARPASAAREPEVMRRVPIAPRADWQKRVATKGLIYHDTDDGRPYWDESAYYEFSAREIDVLDQATCALDQLCLKAVQHIV